jgi:hypothetical protein
VAMAAAEKAAATQAIALAIERRKARMEKIRAFEFSRGNSPMIEH